MITRTLPQKQAFEQNDPLTGRIIACAIEVHKRLGPGLLEKLFLSYMKLTGKKVGLLINFNSKMVKDGIQRFVL